MQAERQMKNNPGRSLYSEELLDQLNEGLIVIDGDGKILFINRAACAILGIRRNGSPQKRLGDRVPGSNDEFTDLIEEGCCNRND
jgi:PAS domain S-box-containing protein